MVPDGCDRTFGIHGTVEKNSSLTAYTGMVSTYMANSVITGSAAAGTAFATGEKTTARFVGVGPRSDDLLSTLDAEDMAEPYVQHNRS
ncbi:MAG: alkaline phosphatase [Methanolobus sp.]